MPLLLGDTTFEQQVHLALQAVRFECGEVALVSSDLVNENNFIYAKSIVQVQGNGDEPNEFMGLAVQFEEETYEEMVARSILSSCRNAGIPTHYLDYNKETFADVLPRERAIILLTIHSWQNGKSAEETDMKSTKELIEEAKAVVDPNEWSDWEVHGQSGTE